MYNNGGSMEETNGAADDKACLCLLKNSWFCCQQIKRVVFFFPLCDAVTGKCRPALFKCRDRHCAGKGLRYPCCSCTEVVIGWITHISCFGLTDRALKAPIITADTAR